jgi:ABC-type polysaccharide/polyol phosphate transport system ATPase subunit
LVSHSPAYIKAYCHRVCVLLRGQLHGFSEVEEGFAFYNEHAAEQ